MPEIQAQVVSVTVRNTSRGSVYDITTSDGATRSVWKAELANALNQYVNGPPIQIRYSQKPSRDGSRIWEDITAFAPPGQSLAPEIQVAQQQFGVQPYQGGMQPGVMQGGAQPIQAAPQQESGRWSEATTIRVTKLACLADASNLIGHLLHGAGPEAAAQAIELVKQTAEVFYASARSHEKAPQTAVAVQTGPQGQVMASQPLTGAQIASDVPGIALGAPQVVATPSSFLDDDAPVNDNTEWD